MLCRELQVGSGADPFFSLRIDPNGNWSLDTAVRMAGRLDGLLEYYEDPTPTLEGMAALHRRTWNTRKHHLRCHRYHWR